ncbi:alginate lyase family protein [Spongiimicrobium salis]|uniref:alginate lyase family protein n=1 Tax=Spongiimicrobium salis TaxID=1667022 RepID=UPI00374DEABE
MKYPMTRSVNPVVVLLFLVAGSFCNGQSHPKLILTKSGVEKIRSELGKMPLFDASLKSIQEEVDAEIEWGIDIPIPKDYSGGYTHERHKRNFFIAQKAGVLFQILQEEKYAIYVKEMLLQYEAIYKDLPIHPKPRSYARGKLFWQCLNDSNWLVYMSQAYDCIYDWLSKKERRALEKNLFKPFANWISIKNPQFYNRVHNHSTWGNAAVGMIGLVMGDEELVERALYGIPNDGLKADAKDNDGGFIKTEGKAGFLANLEEPFSPDGYYTEGPYYQRYAMYPFLIFAVGLHNVKPELNIFAYKDSVLLKSVRTLVDLTDKDGEFFPVNDAQKGMSYHSRELVTAVDIAYQYGTKNPELLSIAHAQNRVALDDSGMAVAIDIRAGKKKKYKKESVNYADGPQGAQGGIAILREDTLELVFKYTAQGLSHGHYDKLSFMLYDHGEDVLQDYGMARFVNIEQKGGGNYLKENKSWAKQTIAHNTLVLDQNSHFNGKYEKGSQHHSELHFFDAANEGLQVVSAKETNAYTNTEMLRTIAFIQEETFEKPFVLDIFKVNAEKEHQYDLPFHFMGQLIHANFKYEMPAKLEALGSKNGYQHLYVEGKGKPTADNTKLSWLRHNRFYTLTTITADGDELFFNRLGAKDPQFNLRRDASFMLRRKNTQSTLFVSTIEAHGSYNPVTELSVNASSSIEKLQVVFDSEMYTAVTIENGKGASGLFILSNKNSSKKDKHTLTINTKNYQWTGPYHFVEHKL